MRIQGTWSRFWRQLRTYGWKKGPFRLVAVSTIQNKQLKQGCKITSISKASKALIICIASIGQKCQIKLIRAKKSSFQKIYFCSPLIEILNILIHTLANQNHWMSGYGILPSSVQLYRASNVIHKIGTAYLNWDLVSSIMSTKFRIEKGQWKKILRANHSRVQYGVNW